MSNWDWRQAMQYHEHTKHTPESVHAGMYFLDWSNKPYSFKKYKNLPSFPLPRDFSLPGKDLFSSLIGLDKAFSRRDVDISLLSSLLFFTAGITRVVDVSYPPYRHYFRTAPGTGALHPTEIYLVIGKSTDDLKEGVYHFNPLDHVLVQLRAGTWRRLVLEATSEEITKTASIILIFTCYGWKNAWKYQKRSYRHWFWDTGVMLTNLLVTAASFNLSTRVITAFQDDLVNELLGIDGRKEASIVIVPINVGADSNNNGMKENSVELSPLKVKYIPLSRTEREFKEVIDAYSQSCLRNKEEVMKWKEKVARMVELDDLRSSPSSYLQKVALPPLHDLLGNLKGDFPTWKVILKRGSARKYTHLPITFNELSLLLYLGTETDLSADFCPSFSADEEKYSFSLNEWYLIVNAVDGLESGAYYYDSRLKTLFMLKKGQFRKDSGFMCLEQALGEDASVVFFLMTPLKRILEILGNRGYRVVQLEAGIRVEIAWLGAYALGLGATGLTFYDNEIKNFFLPHSKEKEPTMVLTVGHPPYRARMGKILPHLENET